MPTMNAGQLDHRNIGSHVSLETDDGTISGALAIVVQDGGKTYITLAHDDESMTVPSGQSLEVSLPPAAAYTLHLKNALEDLIVRLDKHA